ncbi:MAG: Na/Pi cotransporter family protein [Oscillospiraceae bacterium]|jgi:phosphate:Na+ symporter|nr:Na/Pi cotransporter family protein [Oscillospiraceae bacterium]
MTIFSVFTLLGGLALFLYGMSVMGEALEKLAGGKTEKLIARLTSTPWRGALLGLAVTALIQSSSATTVIVVGLVNSGFIKFAQAVGIIMGANIGTTVTGQILRLSDISGDAVWLSVLKPTTLAPLAAVLGMVLVMFRRDAKSKNIGQILLGFGVLFTGMFIMEDAVRPLRGEPWFSELFMTLTNPFLGILAGALVTAVIQSSSASVGILQALTATGAIRWGNAVPIILGQNIGTCITAIIASAGATRAAKRVAAAHLLFNLLGTSVFIIILYAVKAIFGMPFQNNVMNMGDVANFHTLFNVATTLVLLPLSKVMICIATKLVPDKDEGPHPELIPVVLDTRLYTVPSTAIAQARNAVAQMAEIAYIQASECLNIMITDDQAAISLALQRESTLDKLEVAVSNYLVGIAKQSLGEKDSGEIAFLLAFVSDFERIGDYAQNIIDRAGEIYDKKIVFSDSAKQELKTLERATLEVLRLTIGAMKDNDLETAYKVEPLEETIDDICDLLRTRHVDRLTRGECRIESGIVFLEALINYERISDHCSNVAAKLISSAIKDPDTHAIIENLHKGADRDYSRLIALYRDDYAV